MRSKSFTTIGGLILLVVMMFGIGGIATSVQAQRRRGVVIAPRVVIGSRPSYRPWYDYRSFGYLRYNQYVFGSSESAYSHGFKDGLSTVAAMRSTTEVTILKDRITFRTRALATLATHIGRGSCVAMMMGLRPNA